MGHHVADKAPHSGGLHLIVPGHLIDKGTFAVHHLVVGDGQHKVLRKGIEEGKGQGIMVAASEQGIHGHIPEHVVHPAHVPLVVEAQAPQVGGL